MVLCLIPKDFVKQKTVPFITVFGKRKEKECGSQRMRLPRQVFNLSRNDKREIPLNNRKSMIKEGEIAT